MRVRFCDGGSCEKECNFLGGSGEDLFLEIADGGKGCVPASFSNA